jgi:hypothetical protein
MSSVDHVPRATVPDRTDWPRWASATLLVSGIVVVGVETTSWLVVLGLGFLVLGAYGLLVRGRGRLSQRSG